MTKKHSTRLGRTFNGLYLCCVILFVISIAYNHLNIVFHAYPLDYNEAGMLVITSAIIQGENPFSLTTQPSRMSVYPVLYNLVVAPFSMVLGNSLELHRAIAGIFILACAGLCFYLCRRELVARTESAVAAALFYAALLYYSTPIASPNGLGLFLFLCAITVPWVHGFSTRSLGCTIALGILAFYTKQYFIACLGYVALYIFIAESKRRAIYFGLISLFTFGLVLGLVCYFSPYFLGNTIFSQQVSAKLATSNSHLFTQLKEFVIIYLPLLIILAVTTISKLYRRAPVNVTLSNNSKGSAFIDLIHMDKPLLLKKKLDYIWVCCACSVLIVVLTLGRSLGNHLTYFFQLISPFLLVGIFALLSNEPQWRWPFRVLILVALYSSYSLLGGNFSVDERNWRVIRSEIAHADDIYASTLVLKEIMEKGATVYQNGHTRYFVFAKDAPSLFANSDPENRVTEVWERYVEVIQNKIRKKEFDLLLIDQWMPLPNSTQDSVIDTRELLTSHYKKTAVILLPLADRPGGGKFGMEIWKPISAATGVTVQQ